MLTYTIKQNGYPRARTSYGKKKAVELLNKILVQDDIQGTWEKVGVEIRFHYVKDDINGHYTIEREI